MGQEWSELNQTMQLQIKKKETFHEGIETLLSLRKELMEQIMSFKDTLRITDFSAAPFIKAKGYHSKTIAYSLFHVFRIEDIVAHTLIKKEEQIFFAEDYPGKMNSPVITTGNELEGQAIVDFSEKLNIDKLYEYLTRVDNSTTQLLHGLTFQDMKIQMNEQDKDRLLSLKVVSEEENAIWLIDYWCGKNIQGLLRMPFSRHWIMHVNACLRIQNKLPG